MTNFSDLFRIIDYSFKNNDLLLEALTHPSINGHKGYNNKRSVDYQRLEFLGDAVLNMVISEMLINSFPRDKEGLLAKKKIALTCGVKLAEIAKNINIGMFIIMTSSEKMSGGKDNPNNLENVLEALIGAIYLDGGLIAVKKFIYDNWLTYATKMVHAPQDDKTTLQELVQSMSLPVPTYNIIESSGPSHKPLFTVEVNVMNYGSISSTGFSRKSAEQKAASLMLFKMKGLQKIE